MGKVEKYLKSLVKILLIVFVNIIQFLAATCIFLILPLILILVIPLIGISWLMDKYES